MVHSIIIIPYREEQPTGGSGSGFGYSKKFTPEFLPGTKRKFLLVWEDVLHVT